MTRIDPEDDISALKKKGAKPMDFTGRVMKGFLFVDDTAVDKDGELEYWVDLCMKYNQKAKSKAKAKATAKDRPKAEAKSNEKAKAKEKVKTKSKVNKKVKA